MSTIANQFEHRSQRGQGSRNPRRQTATVDELVGHYLDFLNTGGRR
jgi:hypothetical protein